MNDELPTLKVRGRIASQDRSHETKLKIGRAAIEVIAEVGLARLTHRLVAERAGVSLAATTYYYQAKEDIIADVSNMLLAGYVSSFEAVTKRIEKNGARSARAFRDLVIRVLANAAGKNRSEALAWMELLLDVVRHPENLRFSREWSGRLEQLWADIARSHGVHQPAETARSTIDLVIGMQLAILALGLSEKQVVEVLANRKNPFQAWRSHEDKGSVGESKSSKKMTPKALVTRDRIINATMNIITSEGVGAVSYRLVSQRAGLTAAAPAYYFSKPSEMLRAAQDRLFEDSKSRYRAEVSGINQSALTLEQLVDLTAAVFFKEANLFGEQSLASYRIWLEGARQPELRPKIWSAVEDQGMAWDRIIASLRADPPQLHALIAQFLFIGKLIRIVCLGAATPDLAEVRREFYCDLKALIDQTHWLITKKVQNNKKVD